MFGLDDRIASMSDGATLLVVVLVALVLGLRHASDPDHLAAVTTLIASSRDRAVRLALTCPDALELRAWTSRSASTS